MDHRKKYSATAWFKINMYVYYLLCCVCFTRQFYELVTCKSTRFSHVKDADPTYTKFKMEEMIISLTLEEIYEEVAKTGCKNIVLTGGEPMMQLEELSALIEFFHTKADDYFFEIE